MRVNSEYTLIWKVSENGWIVKVRLVLLSNTGVNAKDINGEAALVDVISKMHI